MGGGGGEGGLSQPLEPPLDQPLNRWKETPGTALDFFLLKNDN